MASSEISGPSPETVSNPSSRGQHPSSEVSSPSAGGFSLSGLGDGMPFSSPWAVLPRFGHQPTGWVRAATVTARVRLEHTFPRVAMLRRWLLPPVKHCWGTWAAGPVSAVLAEERTLPLVAALADLFPGRSLRRGSTVVVSRGAFPGATSLALALLSGPCAGGSWCAVVGAAELGLVAAAQHGLDLERLALVPSPGAQWPVVTAALLEGFDVVLVCPPAHVSRSVARQLEARGRERGSVLAIVGEGWPAGRHAPGHRGRLLARPGRWPRLPVGPRGGGGGGRQGRCFSASPGEVLAGRPLPGGS